jgi:hypothetical protein
MKPLNYKPKGASKPQCGCGAREPGRKPERSDRLAESSVRPAGRDLHFTDGLACTELCEGANRTADNGLGCYNRCNHSNYLGLRDGLAPHQKPEGRLTWNG